MSGDTTRVRDLTPKQAETIELAHRLGFYETPRRSTLDTLAQELGISKAAVHNRLQAAERVVITDWIVTRAAGRVAMLEAAIARERARTEGA